MLRCCFFWWRHNTHLSGVAVNPECGSFFVSYFVLWKPFSINLQICTHDNQTDVRRHQGGWLSLGSCVGACSSRWRALLWGRFWLIWWFVVNKRAPSRQHRRKIRLSTAVVSFGAEHLVRATSSHQVKCSCIIHDCRDCQKQRGKNNPSVHNGRSCSFRNLQRNLCGYRLRRTPRRDTRWTRSGQTGLRHNGA